MAYCSVCGNEYQLGLERCPRCGSTLPILPSSEVIHRELQQQTDIRLRRVFAGTVDLAIAAVIASVSLRFFLLRFPTIGRARALILAVAIAVLPAAYLLLRDSLGGKSIGKLLVGLTVVNSITKKRAGIGDSVMRNLVFGFSAVPVIGWVVTLGLAAFAGIAIMSGRRTRLGEGLSHTRVVDDRVPTLDW